MLILVLAILNFVIWVTLVAMGKGGFVHLLLLGAAGLGVTHIVLEYRSRMTE